MFRPDGPNAFPARFAKLDRMHNEGPTLTVPDLAGYPGPSLVMVGDDQDETPIEHTLEIRVERPKSTPLTAPPSVAGRPAPVRCGRLVGGDGSSTEFRPAAAARRVTPPRWG